MGAKVLTGGYSPSRVRQTLFLILTLRLDLYVLSAVIAAIIRFEVQIST